MSDMSNMHEPTAGVGRVPEWSFVDRLRKARESAGLDQARLAGLLAKRRSTISNWERGTNRPDDLALRAIAYVTDVDYRWLVHGIEPHTPPDQGVSPTGCYGYPAAIIDVPGVRALVRAS
jgi:transcriptional regulator with XRE-family HTH domain